MTNMIWLRSHVERCLQDIRDDIVSEPDEDGDYLVVGGTAAGWVSIGEGDPTLVRVTVWAAIDVPMNAKVARELNDLNGHLRSGRIMWAEGRVCVVDSMLAEAVTRLTLEYALGAALAAANEIGPVLAAVFGGQTPIEASAADESAA